MTVEVEEGVLLPKVKLVDKSDDKYVILTGYTDAGLTKYIVLSGARNGSKFANFLN